MKKNLIKRPLLFALCAVMMLNLTACGYGSAGKAYMKQQISQAMKEQAEKEKEKDKHVEESESKTDEVQTETEEVIESTPEPTDEQVIEISQTDLQNIQNIRTQVTAMQQLNTGLMELIYNRYADENNATASVSDVANYAYEYMDEIQATYDMIYNFSSDYSSTDLVNTYVATMDYFSQIYDTYNNLYQVGLTNANVISALQTGNATSVGTNEEIVVSEFDKKKAMVEALQQISYPSFMELPMVELVENYYNYLYAYQELYKGYQLDDLLRQNSALNTLDALQVQVSNAAEQFDADVRMQCVAMYNRMNESLNPLGQEILDAVDRLEVNMPTGRFTYQNQELSPEIDWTYIDTIFPALYNSVDYVISMSAICEQGACDVLIEAEIEGFSQKYSQKVTLDREITRLYIKPTLLSDLKLSSQKNTQLKISVTNLDNNKIIIQDTKTITLMSLYDLSLSNEENGMHPYINTLAWVTPEADEIKALKRLAIEEIVELTKDSEYWVETDGGIVNLAPMTGLVGYQPGNLQIGELQEYFVRMQALAIQCAMSDAGIAYNMSSYSSSDFAKALQRVVPPAETINSKSGVCIETSLVMASALQSANMHCMLVFPPGHCQVAVEIWETGEYILIETTSLPITSSNYRSAVQYLTKKEWAKKLSESYVIDCNMAPYLDLTPIYY
ncbi:MAG: hypothetical protein E7287_04150 [Lachnospiraceae bacterium]|nr:hypothetical protein [Lachnospiraceae bacterium]